MPTNNVIITDEAKLNSVKRKIAADGPAKLQVVSDFDRTLTPCYVNGEMILSIVSLLRSGHYLTSDYAAKAQALFLKYHPIEIDPKISLKEKRQAMREWWTAHFDLLLKSGLTKKDLIKVSKSHKVILRAGGQKFFDLLSARRVPLIILSGTGMGTETITLCLKKFGKLSKNVHIVSNSFIWDRDRAVGVNQPIIYTFNKNYTAVKKFAFFNKIKERKNVILLGDGLGDALMIKGFKYDNIIKIGFLNENLDGDHVLASYKRFFDVIILNDGPMDYVNALLGELAAVKSSYL